MEERGKAAHRRWYARASACPVAVAVCPVAHVAAVQPVCMAVAQSNECEREGWAVRWCCSCVVGMSRGIRLTSCRTYKNSAIDSSEKVCLAGTPPPCREFWTEFCAADSEYVELTGREQLRPVGPGAPSWRTARTEPRRGRPRLSSGLSQPNTSAGAALHPQQPPHTQRDAAPPLHQPNDGSNRTGMRTASSRESRKCGFKRRRTNRLHSTLLPGVVCIHSRHARGRIARTHASHAFWRIPESARHGT